MNLISEPAAKGEWTVKSNFLDKNGKICRFRGNLNTYTLTLFTEKSINLITDASDESRLTEQVSKQMISSLA